MEHSFDIDIAVKVGVHGAILYNNIKHWIAKNAANQQHFHDGRYWTYNSKKAFATLFPYLTERQIKTALDKLREEGLIAVGNYNTNPYDKTLWYTILSDSIGQKSPIERTDMSNPSDEKVLSSINRYKNTDNKPDINDIPPDVKVVAHLYGEYKNVRLTDPELEKLQHEFPTDWEGRIEKLSAYMASTGKVYKNHLATIRNWNRMEQERSQPKQGDGWDHLDQLAAEGRL